MNILIVVDKPKSAIDRLAWSILKGNRHLNIRIFPVHPKRPDPETLASVKPLLEWADILQISYWRSGEVLKDLQPELFASKPKILCHHNPYDVHEQNWTETYDVVTVGNTTIHANIPYARLIPLAVDVNFYKFKEKITKEPIINMVVGRIEGKKGVREVAQACNELGYKFHLIGRISKPDYFKEVQEVAGENFKFFEDVSDQELKEHYHESMVHVCNSVDGFESGTMPILEAMLSGVPVLTRNVGHVPDLNNGTNMVVRKGEQDDLEDLKKNLKELVENEAWREKLRQNAWDTARTRDDRIMAMEYRKLYWSLYHPDKRSASVIIPTVNNTEGHFMDCLTFALEQDYEKYEVVVADSSPNPLPAEALKMIKERFSTPFKYIHFRKNGYSLAEARNRAVIESDGQVLVLCDDRLQMQKDAVSEFLKYVVKNGWAWGVKDDSPKGFVENFSAVNRHDFIKHGMFNERIQWYGGMTQEVRTRYERENGFGFALVDTAKAYQTKRAKSKNHRRSDIVNAKFTIYKLYDY